MKMLLPILCLFVLASCDIFETRNAETPEDTRSNYTSPLIREDLISNLINSFSDKNAENYKKSFAVAPELTTFEFKFTPSGQALNQYQIWEDWSVDDEFRYFANLVNSTPSQFPITLSLSNELFSPSNEGFIYTADYFISVPQLNADPKTYSGNLKFNLTTNINNFWVIYSWEDIAVSGSLSWSDLKGSAYN
jgi:hypothetical protein